MTTLSSPTLLNAAYFVAGGVAVSATNYIISALNKPMPVADQKIRELFQRLHINEWHLPGLSSNLPYINPNIKPPQPIFNMKIQSEIDVIKQRIEKAKERDGEYPLPNLVITGRPGVGKSMVARDIIFKSGAGFICVPPGILDNHIKTGTHITTLYELIDVSKLCDKKVALIFDDSEGAFSRRPILNKPEAKDTTKAEWITDIKHLSNTIDERRSAWLSAVLEETGKDNRNVSAIATTNLIENFDPAFLTRAHVLVIDAPGEEERKNIIIQHLPLIFENRTDILSFFDKRILSNIAKKTEGFTGRNLLKMLEDLYACIQIDNWDIREETIDAAIIAIKRSIDEHNMAKNTQPASFESRIHGISKKFQNIFS